MEKARKSPWRRRLGILLMSAAVVLLLVYISVPVAVLYGVPWVARSYVHGDLRIGSARFDPWSLRLDLADVAVTDADGQPLATVARLALDAELRSVWEEPLAILHELRLDQPTLLVERDEQGDINLLSLLRDTGQAGSGGIPLVHIARLEIRSGSITLRDKYLDATVEETIDGVDLLLTDLRTQPTHSNQHTLAAALLGGNVQWQGDLILQDLDARGTLTATGLTLAPLQPYVLRYAGYAVQPGRLDVEVEVDVAFRNGRLEGALRVPAMRWQRAQVQAPTTLLQSVTLAQLSLQDLATDLSAQTATLGRVLIESVAAAPIGDVGRIEVEQLQADVRGRSLSIGSLVVADVLAVLDPLAPASDTPPVEPHSTDAGAADVTSPLAGWEVRLGQVELENVAASFLDHPLASWKALVVEQARVGVSGAGDSLTSEAEAVRLDGPAARVAFTEAGEPEAAPLARSDLLRQGVRQLRNVDSSLGAFALSDGRIELEDRSQPVQPLRLVAQNLKVQATNLLRDPERPATWAMSANVGDTGLIQSEGSFNALTQPFTLDLLVAINGLNMQTFDGYARRYVGHSIQQGVAGIELKYQLRDTALAGDNQITLDRFYLGQSVPSEQAINAPVKFALDLLRDRNEQVLLRVPISGDVDNPSFDLQQVITRAITNIIVKTVTAPFSLLANLVAPPGDSSGPSVAAHDLSVVLFEPGSAELGSSQREELSLLADALYQRPALRVQVVGEADAQLDGHALKRAQLLEAIRRRLLAQATAADMATPDDAQVRELYEQAIWTAYEQVTAGQLAADLDRSPGVLEELAVASDEASDATLNTLRVEMRGGRRRGGLVRRPDDVTPEAEAAAIADLPEAPFVDAERVALGTVRAPLDALRELAAQRSRAVVDAILATGKVEPDRLIAADPVPNGAARVQFILR